MNSSAYVFLVKADLPSWQRVFQGGAIEWPDFSNPNFQEVLKENGIGERTQVAIFNVGDNKKVVTKA